MEWIIFILLLSVYPLLVLYAWVKDRKVIKERSLSFPHDKDYLQNLSSRILLPNEFITELSRLKDIVVSEKQDSNKIVKVEYNKYKVKGEFIINIAQKYNLHTFETSTEILDKAVLITSINNYQELLKVFNLKDFNNQNVNETFNQLSLKYKITPVIKGIDEDYVEIVFENINEEYLDSFISELLSKFPSISEFQSEKMIKNKLKEQEVIYFPFNN